MDFKLSAKSQRLSKRPTPQPSRCLEASPATLDRPHCNWRGAGLEALLLRTAQASDQATGWHMRWPPVQRVERAAPLKGAMIGCFHRVLAPTCDRNKSTSWLSTLRPSPRRAFRRASAPAPSPRNRWSRAMPFGVVRIITPGDHRGRANDKPMPPSSSCR
jgi:hypothetical protein